MLFDRKENLQTNFRVQFSLIGLKVIISLNIMKKIFQKHSTQALRTFFGTAMIKFATGIIGIWGTINLYYLSYLKNTGSEITSKTNSFLLLCVIIPTSIFILIATKFSSYMGYKSVIKWCAIFFSLSPLVINIKLNLFTLALFFLLIPMSCFALSSIPILNCLWSQFPKDLNKVSGSAVLFFSLGMILWNIIFFQIVNPDNKPAEIDQFNQAYFSKDISDRVITATNLIFTIAGAFYITGSYLIHKKEEISKIPSNQIVQSQDLGPVSIQLQKKQEGLKILTDTAATTTNQKLSLLKVLMDKKFIILFLIAFLVPLYIVYLVMFMKIIFMPIVNDDRFLAMCAIILTISAIFGAPFWGLLADNFGFKKTLFIVCVVDIICKFFGIFCNQKWSIAVMYFLVGFTDKGVMTIIGPGLIQIFGLQMATQLIPYKGFAMVLAYITVPFFQMILGSILTYKQMLILFNAFALISVLLSFYFWKYINYPIYQEFKKETKKENIEITYKIGTRSVTSQCNGKILRNIENKENS